MWTLTGDDAGDFTITTNGTLRFNSPPGLRNTDRAGMVQTHPQAMRTTYVYAVDGKCQRRRSQLTTADEADNRDCRQHRRAGEGNADHPAAQGRGCL